MATHRNHYDSPAPKFCAEALESRLLLSHASLAADFGTLPPKADITLLGNLGDWALFSKDDGVHGVELYRSDGTRSGTILLKDINPGPKGSNPQFFAEVNDSVLFSAEDRSGLALWKTDGSSNGTVKIQNFEHLLNNIVLGKTLIFATLDSAHGRELWRTDGTTAGTTLLKDLTPGPDDHEMLSNFQFYRGEIYFEVGDAKPGAAIWRTNGTPRGTEFFTRLRTKPISPTIDVTSAGNTLYFIDAGEAGFEEHVWKCDGKTVQLIATVSSAGGFGLYAYAPVGDSFYFVRGDTNTLIRADTNGALHNVAHFDRPINVTPIGGGAELHSIAHVNAATHVYYFVLPGAGGADSRVYAVHGDKVALVYSGGFSFEKKALQVGDELYFAVESSRESLWHSDGTAKGTVLLGSFASIGGFTPVGSDLYFISAPVINDLFTDQPKANSATLWKTNGTPQGTRKVTTFVQSVSVSLLSSEAIAGTRTIYFTVDETFGRDVWRSNGTPEGTFDLRDDVTALRSSNPSFLTIGVGGVYFFANRGAWIRDARGKISQLVSSAGDNQTHFFGQLDGAEIIATDVGLWRSDGTPSRTKQFFSRNIVEFNDNISDVSIAGGLVYFEQATALWRSDGTTAGTQKLKDLHLGGKAALGDTFIFGRNGENFANELWRSDGTRAGTMRILPLHVHDDLVNFKGSVYFRALDDNTAHDVLWQTDGTTAGTLKVKEFTDQEHNVAPFLPLGDSLYFLTTDFETGLKLWKTDGTTGGTELLKSLPDAFEVEHARDHFLVALGNRLIFSASDPEHGWELWTSDGTSKGTKLLKDIHVGRPNAFDFTQPEDIVPPDMGQPLVVESRTTHPIVVGKTAYFAAYDGPHGIELWKTDGTPHGTVMVQDIFPGPGSSWPQHFAVQGDTLLFSAMDPIHGRELWQLPLA